MLRRLDVEAIGMKKVLVVRQTEGMPVQHTAAGNHAVRRPVWQQSRHNLKLKAVELHLSKP
jgi:hypothetical protein